jgi:uncharacterized membrane protein
MMFYLIVTILGWGFWSFFDKKALLYMSPAKMYFFSCIVGIFELPLWYYIIKKEGKPGESIFTTNGLTWFFLAVSATTIASYCYLYVLRLSHAGWVSSISSLYLLITFFLSVMFLKEPITVYKLIGVVLMIVGAGLLGFNK